MYRSQKSSCSQAKYSSQWLHLNKLPHTQSIMLGKISVSVASRNFSVVGSVHFSVLYIVTFIYFCCIIADYSPAYADTTLKISTTEHRDHVAYSSWFSCRQKRHLPLLHFSTGGHRFFPRVAATMNLTRVIKNC